MLSQIENNRIFKRNIYFTVIIIIFKKAGTSNMSFTGYKFLHFNITNLTNYFPALTAGFVGVDDLCTIKHK